MDHYSIVEPPSPREKDNGAVSEEAVPEPSREAGQTAGDFAESITDANPILLPEEDHTREQGSFVPAPGEADLAAPSEQAAADLDAVLQAIVQKAQYISNATGAAIALRQDSDVVCRAASGSSAPDRGARLQIKSGLTAECLRTGELMRCDNAMLDPRVDLESCKRLGIESIIIVPILRGSKVEGVLELFSAHAYSFQERDVDTVKTLAEEISRTLDEVHKPPPRTEAAPVAQPVDYRPDTCGACGAKIANDAVFCTECGSFQEEKPGSTGTDSAQGWKARITGRRLLVPSVFVAMALAVALVPLPHQSGDRARSPEPVQQAALPSSQPAANVNPGNSPANANAGAKPATPPAANPGIANSVKQLLGGVSSDFSKLLPVNEQAEPASTGDPNLKVWVDTRKGFYYCPGDEQYGHTEKGAFMTQKQAESNYYIPALIKPCM